MHALLEPAWPYLMLLVIGFLPSEIWRMLAVYFSHGLSDSSEILVWVRLVAATLLAGVVAKLIFFPSGALAAVPLAIRAGALAAGVTGFLLIRRSVLAGIVIGEALLIVASWWIGL